MRPSEHVLVASLGPVQGFIGASRRGRDLWFSSWLLSELARAAAIAAREHLVMPTSVSAGTPISNKLLLLVRRADPHRVAEAMGEAIRARLLDLASTVLRSPHLAELVDVETAREQILDLPEFQWASTEIRDDRGYRDARRAAEALLAARKSARPFTAPSWAAPVPKSSLDGERESVILADRRPGRRSPEVVEALHRLGIASKERLCGVGLLKRLGYRADPGASGGHVQSTSHVASWSLRRSFDPGRFPIPERAALVGRLREAFLRYEGALSELRAELSRTPVDDPVLGRCDGHVLYETRLTDLFPDGGTERVERARAALRALFRSWRQAAEQEGVALPVLTPYYAVLVADGDRMGQAIDDLERPEQHRQVTEALEAFATGARAVVEDHRGHCVYAGGDDVLALVPVTEVVACARALKGAFGPVAAAFASLGASRPTLSVGVNIAHHVDPLQDALEGARAAERFAKRELGRDAWVVRVDKRGGAPVLTGGKWSELGELERAVDALLRLDLPRGLPHELLQVAGQVPGPSLARVRRAELGRVLAQKDLARDLFNDALGEDCDLEALARRLVVARALSGVEADHGR